MASYPCISTNAQVSHIIGRIKEREVKSSDTAQTNGRALRRAATYMYIPWICDCALLCKLLAFHPARITPWKKRAAIMAFPLTMHVLRVPLLVTIMINPINERAWPLAAVRIIISEGALQVAENCFCSGFLLHKVGMDVTRQRNAS